MNITNNINPSNTEDLFSYMNRSVNSTLAYKKVYVSIGSKINEFDVPTNASCQMVPVFLQTDDFHKTLIIIIDDFRDADNYIQNRKYLEQEYSKYGNIIMCNKTCDKPFITSFIAQLIDFAKRQEITKDNLLICNYIKFRNIPNGTERYYENIIPKTVQLTLKQHDNGEYSNCFYNWFGYNNELYNYIYCYNTHPIVVESATRGLMVFIDNIRAKSSTNIDSTNYSQFWEKIYDITKCNTNKNSILPRPIKDELCKTYN